MRERSMIIWRLINIPRRQCIIDDNTVTSHDNCDKFVYSNIIPLVSSSRLPRLFFLTSSHVISTGQGFYRYGCHATLSSPSFDIPPLHGSYLDRAKFRCAR